jgi:hypothetical protein
MLGKTALKIGDRVDELVGDIQKKLHMYMGEKRASTCGRDENIREELTYVFDLMFNLDVWVHAERGSTDAWVSICAARATRPSPTSPLVFFNVDHVPF